MARDVPILRPVFLKNKMSQELKKKSKAPTSSPEKPSSLDAKTVEIIPGLMLKSNSTSKKTPKASKTKKATPVEIAPTEVDFSSFKTVNPITQLLYTRYRNAKKKLNRIEAFEEQLKNNPNYAISEEERTLISKKDEILFTVRELYTVLPQVAEISQKLVKQDEEFKEKEELRQQEQIEKAIQSEKEKSHDVLSKAINLFTAILLESQQKLLDISSEDKAPISLLLSKIASQPLTFSSELVNFFENSSSETYPTSDFPLSSVVLDQAVDKVFSSFSQNEVVSQQEETSVPESRPHNDMKSLFAIDFLDNPESEFPCDDDFDSPAVVVEPFTIVPPGGIFFLNPSEIYSGEPRALFKSH